MKMIIILLFLIVNISINGKQETEIEKNLETKNESPKCIEFDKLTELILKERKPKVANKEYWSIGMTIGTPSVINLHLAYMWQVFGLQFSGLYMGSAYGLQGSLAWKIGDYHNFMHTFFIGSGYSSITVEKNNVDKTSRWTYGVAGYNLNWFGFFFEIGLALGSDVYTNPQLTGQIGYVYRFNID